MEKIRKVVLSAHKSVTSEIFASVSDDLAKKILNLLGIDVKGFNHLIVRDEVNHTLKEHGISSKDPNPIILEDFDKIPDIIENHDSLEIGKFKGGTQRIVYKKTINEFL